MSHRFVDSFRTGPGGNCSSILGLLESSSQHDAAHTHATVPEYATKQRPRTITTDELLVVISIKHRIVLPDDGSYNPKHVGVNFNVCF
jgi:hypothetical protein